MKKWNEWTKKQKMTLGVAVAIITIGGVVGTNVYAKNQQEQAVTQALETIKKEKLSLEELEKAISDLRDKNNPNFLAKEVDLKSLDAIEKQIDELKKNHVKSSISDVEKDNKEIVALIDKTESNAEAINYQLMTQTKVSQLFSVKDNQFVIQGQEVMLELPIVDDLTLADIEKVVKATRTEGKLMTIPESTDSKKSWEQSIDLLIKEAEKQVTEITALNEAVAKWFNDKEKPLDTVKRDELKAIEKRINSLKNQKAKESLSVKWKQVNEVVVTKEKADADKKEKEEAAKASDNTESKKQNAGKTEDYAVDGNLNNSNWDGQGAQNQGGGNYTPPTNNGGGGYTPPTNNGGGGYTPPTNNGGGGGGTTPPGYDGHADQGELDQQAVDGSNSDATQDPNSPWGKK